MDWKADYYALGNHCFGLKEIQYIENNLKKFPLEDITIGDAGEINKCQVGRLMEDQPGETPRLMNQHLSMSILDMLKSQKAKSFFAKYLGNGDQYIRRCQFNLLHEDSYIGRHLDIDSNPDYQIACVIQLGSKFNGGEFVVYPNKESSLMDAQLIKPEYGSITISNCRNEHEVQRVTSGIRTSFVAFVSTYNGPNKR